MIVTTSCGGAFSSSSCMESVQSEHPSATVHRVREYSFVVIDTCGAVYYIQTMNMTNTGTPGWILKLQRLGTLVA